MTMYHKPQTLLLNVSMLAVENKRSNLLGHALTFSYHVPTSVAKLALVEISLHEISMHQSKVQSIVPPVASPLTADPCNKSLSLTNA